MPNFPAPPGNPNSQGVMTTPNTPPGSQPAGPQGMSPFDPNMPGLPPFDISGILDELSMMGFDFSKAAPEDDEPDEGPWSLGQSPFSGASPVPMVPTWGARMGGVPQSGPWMASGAGPLSRQMPGGVGGGPDMLRALLMQLLGGR